MESLLFPWRHRARHRTCGAALFHPESTTGRGRAKRQVQNLARSPVNAPLSPVPRAWAWSKSRFSASRPTSSRRLPWRPQKANRPAERRAGSRFVDPIDGSH